MHLDSAPTSSDSSPSIKDSGSSSPRRKSGPKPRSNETKTLLFLKKLDTLSASSYDVAHALNLSGSWGPVRAVVILEKLVRDGKAKKMKAGGETRYITA